MAEPTSAQTAAPLGLFARIVGIITSPKATYEKVVAFPKPAGVLFVVAAVIAVGTVAPQFTEKGRQATVAAQVKAAENVSARMGRPLPPEVYSQMEARSRSIGWRLFGAVSPFVGLPIVSLLMAAVYWAAFNIILGGTATYKQVLAIVTHGQVIDALGLLAGLPIVVMSGTMSLSGPFNLGALAPTLDASSKLALFLSSVSLVGLWSALVSGIGLGVLYKRSGLTIGIVLVVIYLLFRFAMTSAFGSFMGAGA